ncbi:unnamed protein product [Rhodiola kirilowii]
MMKNPVEVSGAKSSKIVFEESDESSDEETEIERELAEFTFEELQNARADGSHTIHLKPTQDKKHSRANKNRPSEVTCKKPVSRYREIVQVPKKVVRDPRFESLCGTLNEDGFKKRYNFLYEDNLPSEKQELGKQLRKTNDPEMTKELKNRISWIDRQLKSGSVNSAEAQILAEHKKKAREAAKQGKKPYYIKKSDVRTQMLVQKFEDLKKKGNVTSFIEKKRRKNAAKDHKYMPYRRSVNDE